MSYSYHPEIEGLKVNEDGTEVLLNDAKVDIKTRTEKGRNPSKYILFRNKRINIARLVLECWVGLSPKIKMSARFKDGDYNNTHYSNLEWKSNGGNSKYDTKKQKIKKLEPEIEEALAAGKSKRQIAKELGINRNLI